MAALQQYLVPRTPPANPWIDSNKPKGIDKQPSYPDSPPVNKAASSSAHAQSTNRGRKRSPPTRRLVRHVLRARARAVHALASFFAELERAPEGKRIRASSHLAHLYGGFSTVFDEKEGDSMSQPQGWREAREVLAFLRDRGANFHSLEAQIAGDYWAESRAVLSDLEEEGETEYSSDAAEELRKGEDFEWVSSAIQ